jgi:hypothetical protein
MNLREYLFRHKISVREFAHKINFAPAYVSRHLAGHRRYTGKLALAIEQHTNGELKRDDILGKTDLELESKDSRKNDLFYETLVEFVDPGLLETIVAAYTRKTQAQAQEA